MALCEEMGAHLGRTALSANIRDRRDYSCALFDADGELMAQATHIPVHLGSMAYAMGDLAREQTWLPGDVLILNDPFRGGTHLPDVTLMMPVWLAVKKTAGPDERSPVLLGFCACRAHYADIGAGDTGSMGVSSTLMEEGVLIEPAKLYDQGVFQAHVLQPLLARVRDSAMVLGDVEAQLSTCRLGARRLLELSQSLSLAQLKVMTDGLQNYAEQLARAALANIAKGEYAFSDVLDDDGLGHLDIPIQVRLTVDNEGVAVDFAGTSAQVRGNLNCPLSVTAAAVYYAVRCLLPEHTPACAGAMRPVRLGAPKGCLVNARPPAAVAAGNVETSSRIVDVLMGALAQAMPGRMPADSQGTMNNLAMAGTGWSYYETLAGGCGGGPAGTGGSAMHSHMTNTLNTPVEILESIYPLRITRYAIRRGSGGAGAAPGGDGLVRTYQFLADAHVAILSERRRHGPSGANGAADGEPGCNRFNGQIIAGKCEFTAHASDELSIETPGGGGWSAPD